jgi:hypothetical protein
MLMPDEARERRAISGVSGCGVWCVAATFTGGEAGVYVKTFRKWGIVFSGWDEMLLKKMLWKADSKSKTRKFVNFLFWGHLKIQF